MYLGRHTAVFFCSSRRRHTRGSGDWSSDVCSSDLATATVGEIDLGDVTGDVTQIDLPDGRGRSGLLAVRSVLEDIEGLEFIELESSDVVRHRIRSEERRGGKECRSRWSPYH